LNRTIAQGCDYGEASGRREERAMVD